MRPDPFKKEWVPEKVGYRYDKIWQLPSSSSCYLSLFMAAHPCDPFSFTHHHSLQHPTLVMSSWFSLKQLFCPFFFPLLPSFRIPLILNWTSLLPAPPPNLQSIKIVIKPEPFWVAFAFRINVKPLGLESRALQALTLLPVFPSSFPVTSPLCS